MNRIGLALAVAIALFTFTNIGLAQTPHVISTSPAQNELNVPVDASISVTFDIDMDEATINSFTFVVNDPDLVHFSYQRYLENKLRQTFGFSGTSLRLFFKKAPPKSVKTRGKSR